MPKETIIALAIGCVLLLSLPFIAWSLNKAERSECLQWQHQAEEIPSFYLLDWQAQQCQARGVIL